MLSDKELGKHGMRALEQTISKVGAPLFLAEFRNLDGHAVAVAHWRHGDTCHEIRSSDALRVGMNLGGVFKGRHAGAGQVVGISGVPGAVGLFAPGASCETIGEGEIDVVEIYIDARRFGYPAEGWPDLPPLDVEDETVRAAVVAAFVAAQAGNEPRARQAATALERAACRFLHSQMRPRGDDHVCRGGLRPAACQRVERLIKQRLDALSTAPPHRRCSPSVEALAAEAKLSVNQFIRAFRQTIGTTPHQYVMVRRRQRAMALLGEPGLSVAEVADALGFSSPAHFIASFRKTLGVTPGDYRDAVLRHGS